jgi:hypothetical protein
VLNYRTDEMPIREMTYLFTLIALPVMNAFMLTGVNLLQVLAANSLIRCKTQQVQAKPPDAAQADGQ